MPPGTLRNSVVFGVLFDPSICPDIQGALFCICLLTIQYQYKYQLSWVGRSTTQDCPNVWELWVRSILSSVGGVSWGDSHHQSARSHCLSLCGYLAHLYRHRLFKRWGGSFMFIVVLWLPFQRIIMLFRVKTENWNIMNCRINPFTRFLSKVCLPTWSKLGCSSFVSDALYPEHAGVHGNCTDYSETMSHDFAMLILKVRLDIQLVRFFLLQEQASVYVMPFAIVECPKTLAEGKSDSVN